MHGVKFEPYLERKSSANYFDTKLTIIAFRDENLHAKEIVSKSVLSHRVVKSTLTLMFRFRYRFSLKASHGDYFLNELIIRKKYRTI